MEEAGGEVGVMELRPYQRKAIEELREGIRQGHVRQVLCAPTGSGKTHIAIWLLREAASRMSKTAFVCDRIALVDQTSSLLASYGIEHGVIQAGHWRWRPYEWIQVCSAQTLARRGIMEGLKLVVVDECHTMYRTTVQFLLRHPNVVAVGLSATPFTRGLADVYSRVVNAATTDELLEMKWLVPIKAYAAKPIDLHGVRVKSSGEWDEEEVGRRGVEIVGDVVSEWVSKTRQHFGGPVKTLLFSATVDHGAELIRQFQAAGFNFQHISYKDGNDEKRRALIEEFRKSDSEIVGLVSCEALSKGFDVPDILCGVSCRPYRKSLSGHIQQLGRVMRPADGKEFALWLDHSGNFLRFYRDTNEFFRCGLSQLKGCLLDRKVRREPTEAQKRNLICPNCSFAMGAKSEFCPSCGWRRVLRSGIAHRAGEMVEVPLQSKAQFRKDFEDFLKDRERVWRQIVHHALERKHGNAIAARPFAMAQYKSLYGDWPPRDFNAVTPEPADPRLVRKIRSHLIAYFNRR